VERGGKPLYKTCLGGGEEREKKHYLIMRGAPERRYRFHSSVSRKGKESLTLVKEKRKGFNKRGMLTHGEWEKEPRALSL